MPASLARLAEVRAAAAEAPAAIRIRNLQATVAGPRDAWGRPGRPQPVLVSASVALRQPFRATSAADALADDTVHYGSLAKAVRASLERLAAGSSLCGVLAHVWADLVGAPPADLVGAPPAGRRAPEAPQPLLGPGAVGGLELTAHLPKASLLGDGVSATLAGVLGDDVPSARTHAQALRLHNVRMPALIGINSNEREAKQAVAVSVEVGMLEDGADDMYCALEQAIAESIDKSAFGTLEALADALARAVAVSLRDGGHERRGVTGLGMPLTVAVEKPLAVPFADAPCVELRTYTGAVLNLT